MSDPYPEFVARFYDVIYAQVRDGVDNAWYLDRMAAAVGPVLEIGVGTGRLFVEARRRGIDAWGIDMSPAMIERCRLKLPPGDHARVSVGDAVHLRTDQRYALVCAPFRVLSHVHETREQLRLLDAVHDCLEPGGAFIFDLHAPNMTLFREGLHELNDFDGEHAPGLRLRRTVSYAPTDLSRQTSRVRIGFLWQEAAGEHREDWDFDMRFYFRFEVEHLVARSKLTLDTMFGDFDGGPVTADSREYVIVCRRPTE